MSESLESNTSPPATPIRRRFEPKPTVPVKAYRLDLGPTFSVEMVNLLISEGYTHFEFPDGIRIKIFKIGYPCKGMKLEVGAATPEQYHLVGVMEDGWTPAITH